MRDLFRCSLVALALAPVGCGIFEDAVSDAVAFTVCTDPEVFTIDSAQVGLTGSGAIPAVPCSASDVCAQASALDCSGAGYECKVQCGGSGNCEVQATFAQHSDVDISKNVQGQTSATALSKVSLNRVEYNVTANTLNFDTPEIELHVGPSSAAKVGDSGVVKFAKMPVITAGATTANPVEIKPDPAGSEALSGYVKSYQTPFRVFGKATLSFASGSSFPSGKLTLSVKSCFKATPL